MIIISVSIKTLCYFVYTINWTEPVAKCDAPVAEYNSKSFALIHLRQCMWISLHQRFGRFYTGTLNLPTHFHSVCYKRGTFYFFPARDSKLITIFGFSWSNGFNVHLVAWLAINMYDWRMTSILMLVLSASCQQLVLTLMPIAYS